MAAAKSKAASNGPVLQMLWPGSSGPPSPRVCARVNHRGADAPLLGGPRSRAMTYRGVYALEKQQCALLPPWPDAFAVGAQASSSRHIGGNMKKSEAQKNSSSSGKSASQLIDAKIEKLGDWR